MQIFVLYKTHKYCYSNTKDVFSFEIMIIVEIIYPYVWTMAKLLIRHITIQNASKENFIIIRITTTKVIIIKCVKSEVELH